MTYLSYVLGRYMEDMYMQFGNILLLHHEIAVIYRRHLRTFTYMPHVFHRCAIGRYINTSCTMHS